MLTIKISNPIKEMYKAINMPAEEEDIYNIMEEFGDYIITDHVCELGHIHLDKNIHLDYLNELVKEIAELNQDEKIELSAILEASYSDLEDAFITFENKSYVLYRDMTLSDVAEELVSDGAFGEIPEQIMFYIDYDAIARDLSYSGYVETKNGVLVVD
ncbi:MAG: antirestriction protein ArdA [Acutalibacteraceae bacterium]